ncbi:MAG: ferredoxin-type protein NapF [Gammaproteobacteria bacterium]
MDPARRQFLRARPVREATARPPWSVAEEDFTGTCSRCDECVSACPQRVLVRGDGGFPEFSPRLGGCDFCGKCVTSCDTGALNRAIDDDRPALPWHAVIGSGCLANTGVECRICAESCERMAIRVRLVVGGAPMPELDAAACNGCGFCIHDCPSAAITLKANAQ